MNMRPMERVSIGRLKEHEAYGVVEDWKTEGTFMRPMEWLSIGRLKEHEAYGVGEYWKTEGT